MIGLGGGSFADFLADTFPHWKIKVVEIDPVVIRLARKYFPIHKRIEIIQDDGRVFLQNAREKYDIIIMDAFGEHFIPPDLYTLEFFQLLKSSLAKNGLALMNAWENDSLNARELATLRRVFEKGYYIHHPQEQPGNRIYLLAREMDMQQVVKERIVDNFIRYNFPGEPPQAVLSDLKDLRAGPNPAEPVTDANVRALFAKTPLD